MRKQFKNLFKNMRLKKVLILAVIIPAFLAQGMVFASVQQKDQITRGEFIKMLAQNHSDNPLLPSNHSQLSPKPLFAQVAKNLKARGVNVLENKSSDDVLTQQEFVRITYAFSGGKPNKTLFDQKLFLKNAGIVSSTDIGIATGVDGKVYQTHKGQTEKHQTELASPIFMDDKFETDYSSKALFTFDDESTLTMSEDTVININTHVFNPDKNLRETLIKASLGWVRFKVTKDMTNGSSFKVVTPTATAGVRGTEFAVFTNPQGKTTFVVLEGKIETFSNKTNGKGKTFFISAGEVQDFSPDGSQSAVRKASPQFLAKVVNKTTKPKALLVAKGIGKGLAKLAAKSVGKGLAKGKDNNNGNGKGLAKGKGNNNGNGKSLAKGNRGNGNDKAFARGKRIKGNTKNFAKGSAKNSAKFVAKGSAKGAAKDSAKLAAKGSAKLAAKDSAKGAAKDSAKSAAKDSAKSSAKSAAKDSAKSAAKDSAKSAAKDSAKSAAKDSAKSAAKDSAKSAAKDSAKSAAKDSAKETAKQVAKENGNNGKGKGNS